MNAINMMWMVMLMFVALTITCAGGVIYLHQENKRLLGWAARLARSHKATESMLASRNQFLWDTDLLKQYRQWYLKPSNLMADADLIPWRDPRDPEVSDKLKQAMIAATNKLNGQDADVDIICLPDDTKGVPAKPELGEKVALGFLKT